ncbi:MAG: HAD-IA family hydrolase [Candidatus Margulisiibacteriota bacterium]
MIPVDLLLFDFDGTLADSLPAAVAAIQAMLEELKYPPKTAAEINSYIGFGEVALVAGAIGSDDPAKLRQARDRYYHQVRARVPEIRLYPHVRETLKYFKDKIKIVLSNKRDEFIHLILEEQGVRPYFTQILGGDSSTCLKPDPCTINELVKKERISKEKTLLVGDMTVDVETGKNAGIRTCAVTYGFDSREKLAAQKPDFLIDDFGKLRELVG